MSPHLKKEKCKKHGVVHKYSGHSTCPNFPTSPAVSGWERELIEELAEVEHNRWSDWQKYVHSRLIKDSDEWYSISANFVERWERQISTPYHDLTEEEKEKDRVQVRRYFPLIKSLLSRHTTELKERVKNLVAIEIKKNHGTRMINSDDVLSLLDNQESKKK